MTRWVATSPIRAAPRPTSHPPYTGPPSYPEVPRWGLPRVTWRPLRRIGTPGPSNAERMRALAGTVVPLLWFVAGTALVAAGAEVWRYTILLASRFDVVPAGPLRASDALVVLAGVVSVLLGALAVGLTLLWLVRAYAAASELAGVAPPRPVWHLVAGVLVPGPNLLVPGAVLAELEHAGLRRPAGRRPTPSRIVIVWWVLWAAGLLAAALTLAWGFRDSVQAQANGVLLHAGTDLLAATVAGLSGVLVRRFSTLLDPAQPDRPRRMVLIRVPGAR